MEQPQITRYNKERSPINSEVIKTPVQGHYKLRTGKEIRLRFGSSEDKSGKEAKHRPTGW